MSVIKNIKYYCKHKNKKNTYCFLDIETSGSQIKRDQIIQVAFYKYVGEEFVDKYESYISCPFSLNPFIVKYTKITDQKLREEGKDIEQVLSEVRDFIGDSILIAHNGNAFDFRFLTFAFEKYNLGEVKNATLDTLPLSRLINSYEKHSLEALIKELGINVKSFTLHNAMDDAKALAPIFFAFKEKLLSQGIDLEENFINTDILLANIEKKQKFRI